jgi:site-specific DNA recombinase
MTMAMNAPASTRRVATYERVSSEDQRERETIKTQTEQLERRLAGEPNVEVVARYVDDGESGFFKSLAGRPGGQRLLLDAAAHRFDELWVYKIDRLGRSLTDMAKTGQHLVEELGIRIVSVVEGSPDLFMFQMFSLLAENEWRTIRRRTGDGSDHSAREGRYVGGIVAFGFRVEGERKDARLVPDTVPLWSGGSAADAVRRIYARLGVDGWTCPQIAAELNALGVPTHYARDGRIVRRGERHVRTRGVWRHGRIAGLVKNPVYRGVLQYGRRATRKREVIAAAIEPLVSDQLWQAAQETLARNRTIARNTARHYLLKSVMHCAVDGLTYIGSRGRQDIGWYRCSGQMADRGPLPGRCPGQALRTDAIDNIVWADVERWLRDPGDVLNDLEIERGGHSRSAVAAAEAITFGHALEGLDAQRTRALGLHIRGRLTDTELDSELDRIAAEKRPLEGRLAALEAPSREQLPESNMDAIAQIRARLDAGLTDEQRQEIVRLLVRATIVTHVPPDGGRKSVTIQVEYRFPCPTGVVRTDTNRDSSRPPIGTGPETRWPGRHGRFRPVHPRGAGGGPRGRRG